MHRNAKKLSRLRDVADNALPKPLIFCFGLIVVVILGKHIAQREGRKEVDPDFPVARIGTGDWYISNRRGPRIAMKINYTSLHCKPTTALKILHIKGRDFWMCNHCLQPERR